MMAWRLFALAIALSLPAPASATACRSCDYSLPAQYAVANALSAAPPVGKYRGEYFDVYSKPMRMRYGDVHNIFNFSDLVPLPRSIVRRFNNSVMAITGFEPNMIRVVNGVESLVPCSEFYNHHWSNLMHGARSHALEGIDELPYYTYPGAMADQRDTLRLAPSRKRGLRRARPPPAMKMGHRFPEWPELSRRRPPPFAAQDALFFSEGNGNEHRLSFHGYARNYAQLIRSPVAFSPGLMFINTKHPNRTGHGEVVPRVSLQPATNVYSPLLECPCSTRRRINITASTIDGYKVDFACVYQGVVSEMKLQNNTACQLETLHGGSKCCADGMVLLDEEQPQPEAVDEYMFKVRFYFEEYTPAHTNLFRVYWQTELKNNEYDVPACDPGTPPSDCVHELSATFEAGDPKSGLWAGDPTGPLVWPKNGGGLKLIYAGGHCHVGCISLELYNADTGRLICRNKPVFGTSASERNDEAMNERGYSIAIPPCVWGDDASERGLMQEPPLIKPTTRLTTIARYNSTKLRSDQSLPISHYAVMASWQMRAAYPDAARAGVATDDPDLHV